MAAALVLASSGQLAVWCLGGLEATLLAGFVALGFAGLAAWLAAPERPVDLVELRLERP